MRSTGYKIVNTGRNEGLRFKKPVGTPEDRKARDLSPPAVYTFKTFYFFLSLSLLSFLFFFLLAVWTTSHLTSLRRYYNLFWKSHFTINISRFE